MTGKLEKSHVLYVTLKLNAHGREGDSAMASEWNRDEYNGLSMKHWQLMNIKAKCYINNKQL